MTKRTEAPWTIKGDMLMDARGTHLFRMEEQPGLGQDADKIAAQIIAAPELFAALNEMVFAMNAAGLDRRERRQRAMNRALAAIAKAETFPKTIAA